MSITATTQVTVTSSGDGVASHKYEPTAQENSNGPAGGPVRVALAAGDNFIAVPTGAMGAVIAPPSSSGVVKRLKNHAGETGFAIRTAEVAAVPLPTGTATLMINAASAEVLRIFWT